MPSEELQTLAEANASLKAANQLQEQKIRFLQAAVTVALASIGGLSVGLATCLARVSPQIALSSSFVVFFGVIMASMAILGHVRR